MLAVPGKFERSVHAGVLRGRDPSRGETLQISSGTERAALAPEDGDVCCIVGIEGREGVIQRVRVLRVNRVAEL